MKYTLLICVLFIFSKCIKEPLPIVGYGNVNDIITQAAINITYNTAVSGGEISSMGSAVVIEKGVCWSTSSQPTINNNKTNNGSGTGIFSSTLTGLVPNTLYYVRAYESISTGTVYGPEKSFSTLAIPPPTITSTTTVTSITLYTATSGGAISSANGGSVIARGVCWNTSPVPTILNSKTSDGTGIGTFTSVLSALVPSTLYYVRAYATNQGGTAYGPERTFTTLNIISPTVSATTAITTITRVSALSGGTITVDNGGSVTARGVCWSNLTLTPTTLNSKTVDGIGIGTFTSILSGLSPSTTYYVRAYATNSAGTGYGPVRIFTTLN